MIFAFLFMVNILWPLSEAMAQNQMDLEKFGYRVEVIKPNIDMMTQPGDKLSKRLMRSMKNQAIKMRKEGWGLYDSNNSIKKVLEWLFYAHSDDDVVVLEERSTASSFEDGWHGTFSKAVLSCLGQYVDPIVEWENKENDSIINAMSDGFVVVDSFEWGTAAYKYDQNGLSYKWIALKSEADNSSALSFADISHSISWDFETVEKAKKEVASGYVVSLYRQLKDVETTQPIYEIVSIFVVKASNNTD